MLEQIERARLKKQRNDEHRFYLDNKIQRSTMKSSAASVDIEEESQRGSMRGKRDP